MSNTQQREKALDELLARQAINDCLVRYIRGIDRHDEELIGSAYHEGALDDHTMYFGLGREFGPTVNAFHSERWRDHQHVLSNVHIDFNGDGSEAHVESYWIAVGVRFDGSVDLHGGRYVDRFDQRDGQWAIAARLTVSTWGLNPQDMAASLAAFPTGRQDKSDVSYQRPLQLDPERLAKLMASAGQPTQGS